MPRNDTKRLLIVENEPTVLLALSFALRSNEVEVVTANRLRSAEEALSRHAFDVVIVDVRLSGILGTEGIELLSYVKRCWPATEVIVIGAHSTDEIRQQAYDRGASHCYDKPVDIRDLIGRLRSIGFRVRE